MQTPMHYLAQFVYYSISLYMMFIMVWVLGSWFPQWRTQQWFKIVDEIIRPYMNMFKALPLRMGMIDFTPMAAIFLLIILRSLLESAIHGGM